MKFEVIETPDVIVLSPKQVYIFGVISGIMLFSVIAIIGHKFF